MRIIVNGEARNTTSELSIAELLRDLELADRPCAVEVNRKVVPRGDHEARILSDGDAVEIVTLVGGG